MSITFVVHVEDRPGVLNRVASLVRRRGYNIESLTVGHTDVAGVSRITLVLDATLEAAARIEANLYKLVDVRRVEHVTTMPSVCRDLALVKVAATADSLSQIVQLATVFRARVVDVATDSVMVEITGTEDKIDASSTCCGRSG
jgi:acetolactate synthase-1/3 small subunit